MRGHAWAGLAAVALTVMGLGPTACAGLSSDSGPSPRPTDTECFRHSLGGEVIFELEGDEITPGKHEAKGAWWRFYDDLRHLDWAWLGPKTKITHVTAVLVKGEGTDWNVYPDDNAIDGREYEALHAREDEYSERPEITQVMACGIFSEKPPTRPTPIEEPQDPNCATGAELASRFRLSGSDITPGKHSNDYGSWLISEDKTTLTVEATSPVVVFSVIIKGVDPDWRYTEAERHVAYEHGSTSEHTAHGPDGEPVPIEHYEACGEPIYGKQPPTR